MDNIEKRKPGRPKGTTRQEMQARPVVEKKPVGRPKGSTKNTSVASKPKPPVVQVQEEAVNVEKKRAGRPKGTTRKFMQARPVKQKNKVGSPSKKRNIITQI